MIGLVSSVDVVVSVNRAVSVFIATFDLLTARVQLVERIGRCGRDADGANVRSGRRENRGDRA